MKKKLFTIKAVIAIIFLTLSFFACDKEFTTIGTDVIGNENFETNRFSYPAVAYNKKLNPVQTNGLPANLLGVYQDPVYGTSSATVVSQLILSQRTSGVNVELDSVVITIPYFSRIDQNDPTDSNGNTNYILDSVYGNTDAPLKLSIFRSNYFLRDFDPDTDFEENQKYYSDGSASEGSTIPQSELEYEEILVLDQFFISSDEIILKELNAEGDFEISQRSIPSLRIVLKPNDPGINFWQETILDKMDDPELSNVNNFKDYFRGIFFKIEQTIDESAMVMLDMVSSSANISMHYKSVNEFADDDGDLIPDSIDSDLDNDGFTDEGLQDTDGDGIIDAADMDADNNGFDDEGKTDINNDGFADEAFPVIQNAAILDFSGNRVNFFENNFSISLDDGDMINGDEKLYLKGGEGSMAIVELFGIDSDNDGVPDYLDDFKNQALAENWLINEANLVFYEDETIINPDDHENDRVYVYDLKNNIYLVDFEQDIISTATPLNSAINHLGRRFTDAEGNNKFKVRITEHINNILLRDSTNTKLGLVLSTNVNAIENSDILGTDGDDDLNKVPNGAVLSQKGTILYGNNTPDPTKKVKLEIFYTKPNE